MKSRSVLSCLAVLSILFASMLGCSKKEEAPPVKEETAPEARVQVAEPGSPEPAVSPLMEQFLGKVVPTKKVTAGHGIRELFDFWQEILHHPRVSMKIYFEVELEEKFQKDHTWKNKTNREILNELCQEYNLVWTITEPDTIQVVQKLE